MASSKVMASSSPSNPDLTRHSSPSPLLNPQSERNFVGSMNMEDIIRNLYNDPDSSSYTPENNNNNIAGAGGELQVSGDGDGGDKAMDDAWREIVSVGEASMTLESFLEKAGVGGGEEEEEDGIRVPAVVGMGPAVIMSGGGGGFGGNGYGNGNGVAVVAGRGKRRAGGGVEEPPLDKATQQKQRRMIKNRESAARSRERKQAYTMELESLVTQLEKENAWLLKQQAEMNKERYKQLMETLIPVVEKRRPPRVLRRVHSMEW